MSASTNGRLHVYLVGDAAEAAEVSSALRRHSDLELVADSSSIAEALDGLSKWDIDAVLFAPAGPELPADDVRALRERSRAPVILLAAANAPQLLEEALQTDVADALLLPQPPEGLAFAVRKAVGRRQAEADEEEAAALIITVFSPKGGTGKTAISTNVATTFAAVHERRTLLVDLDLQFGDCAIALGLEPAKTIYDLLAAPGEIDEEKLSGFTTRHASGLELLAAPAFPEEAELVPVQRLLQLLDVSRGSHDVVVVDTAPFLHGPSLTALDVTDDLLLVAMLDVQTLKSVGQTMQTLEQIEFPDERISLVLNRATAQVGIKPGDAEVALGRRARFTVPEDRAAPLATNRGVPAVLAEPRSDFAGAIVAIAETLQAARVPRRVPAAVGGRD